MLFLILLCIAESKSIRSVIELTNDSPAQYITKFGVDIGIGN